MGFKTIGATWEEWLRRVLEGKGVKVGVWSCVEMGCSTKKGISLSSSRSRSRCPGRENSAIRAKKDTFLDNYSKA